MVGVATNYQRGRAFEYRARDALTKRGAAYVMRAAQSKGKVDLLALFQPDYVQELDWSGHPVRDWAVPSIWLVQCKTGSARMSPADRHDLITLAQQTGGVPVLAEPGPKNRGVVFTNLITKEIL